MARYTPTDERQNDTRRGRTLRRLSWWVVAVLLVTLTSGAQSCLFKKKKPAAPEVVPQGPVRLVFMPANIAADNAEMRWLSLAVPVLMGKLATFSTDLDPVPLWQSMPIAVENAGAARVINPELASYVASGTEATMHAIRVARAYTGRDIILKFEGNYHGFHDHTLWSTYAPVEAYGNRRSPIPVPASSGIPKTMREFIITLPFNDFEGFERVMRSYGEQIAAVISEPCQGNCAAINPQEGFLDLIRKKTEEYGCVFILDEVKTGFRIANGGAQEYYNLKPDLATYAKALGNGYPVAAFGGKKEIMSIIGLVYVGTPGLLQTPLGAGDTGPTLTGAGDLVDGQTRRVDVHLQTRCPGHAQ